MAVSDRIWSCWSPSRLVHHGDLRSSQYSKPQKIHRPPFEWKNKSLLWYPFRCVEFKVTSVTAAEFCRAVILSDLHVPVNSASFIQKTLALNSCFLPCHVPLALSRNNFKILRVTNCFFPAFSVQFSLTWAFLSFRSSEILIFIFFLHTFSRIICISFITDFCHSCLTWNIF